MFLTLKPLLFLRCILVHLNLLVCNKYIIISFFFTYFSLKMNQRLMFKYNPLEEQFHKYDDKKITTLKLKNYSFLKIQPKQHPLNHHQIHKDKSKINQTQRQSTNIPLKHISQSRDAVKNSHQHEFFNLTTRNTKIQNDITENRHSNSQNRDKLLKLNNKIKSVTPEKFSKHKKYSFKDVKLFSSLEVKNSRTLLKNEANKETKFRQKLYKSINFQNILQNIESRVTQLQNNNSPLNSPTAKDKLLLLQKMKRYSKTSNCKARTVFDQFNLKYLINKRKTFNLKNQNQIKGSHMPFFQSFASHQLNIPTCKSPDAHTQRSKRYSPEFERNYAVAKRKKSSFIVIDQNGIIHEKDVEQNPQNHRQLFEKVSGKVINLRKMLKIDRIQAISPISSRNIRQQIEVRDNK